MSLIFTSTDRLKAIGRKYLFALAPVFFLGMSIQARAAGINPEERTVTFTTDTIRIGSLISEIERQTGCLVIYSLQEVDVKQQVHIQNRTMTTAELIDKIFLPMGIKGIFDNTYIILRAVDAPDQPTDTRVSRSESDAGRVLVHGTVSDENGGKIVGATILEKGSSNGTVSDANGNFQIAVNPDGLLKISFLGYREVEIPVHGRMEFQITLA